MGQMQPGRRLDEARWPHIGLGNGGCGLGRAHQQRFRFSDGGAFDFRGGRERSIGGSASPLANFNHRGTKGFITTLEVERTIGFVGESKVDWIFVKPSSLTWPYDADQSYVFAPRFGRTLKELNHSIEDRISDHDPIIVDLPLGQLP